MKKILLLISLLVAIACNRDDGNTDNPTVTLTLTIDSVQSFNATISWVLDGGNGPTLYKIVLDDEVIREAYGGSQYQFTNLQPDTHYNGVVFAISQGGNETFEQFEFTTTTFVNTVCGGIIVLSTQEQVDSFICTEITGSLVITGSNISNLEGLSSLTSIGNGLTVRNTTTLKSLHGLHNVSTELSPDIDFSILLLENDALIDISDLQHFSDRTTDLTVTRNSSLLNLTGLSTSDIVDSITINEGPIENLSFLSNLEQVDNLRLLNLPNLAPNGTQGLNSLLTADRIILNNVGGMQNLSGLESLNSIRFTLDIRNCPDLISLNGLESLHSISTLDINNCTDLISLNGLESLTSLTGSLALRDLENLEDISALAGLTSFSLTSIYFANLNSLTNLTGLNGLQTIGAIRLKEMDALVNLEGLNNLTSIEFSFELDALASFTSMQGLESLESVATFFDTFIGFPGSVFRITNLPQFSSFQGLTNLSFIGSFGIGNCSSLTNLDGLDNVSETYSQGMWVGIGNNVNLTDFCGLSLWVGSNDYMGNPFPITGNGYNPTLLQIASSSECSQ